MNPDLSLETIMSCTYKERKLNLKSKDRIYNEKFSKFRRAILPCLDLDSIAEYLSKIIVLDIFYTKLFD